MIFHLQANSDKRRKKLLDRKRKEISEERKLKTIATQTTTNKRIQTDSEEVDYEEPQPETEDEGVIDDLLMEIKAGNFQCRWFP